MEDQLYISPVAHETVTSALLGDTLPARILVHGPSGNGKSRLLRQIWKTFKAQVLSLHIFVTQLNLPRLEICKDLTSAAGFLVFIVFTEA